MHPLSTITSTTNAHHNLVAGSSDLWVPSKNCTQSACVSKHKYDPTNSSTSAIQKGTFSTRYGDGSTSSGPIFTDTVAIAGIKSTAQAFSAVTSLSSSFGSDPIDGILGMAYQKISALSRPPFVNQAKAQGSIKSAVFGMKLSKTGSELYIGGTDAALYKGAVESHSVTGSGYWQIGGASAVVGSKTTNSGFQTVRLCSSSACWIALSSPCTDHRQWHDHHVRSSQRCAGLLCLRARLVPVRLPERLLPVPLQRCSPGRI